MNIFKILGIVVIAGIVMTFGSEIGERFSIPEAQRLVPSAEARRRASADSGERCRGGAAYNTAMRGRRI